MNAPTPLQLRAGGAVPQLNNPLTAVIRVVNPHYSLGVDHKIITGILADASDTLTQKAISSSNASESWRASVLDIFADLYGRANAANRELLVYISDRHVRDMLIESAASFSQTVFATNLYDQLGSRLRLLYDAAGQLDARTARKLEMRRPLVVYTDGSVSATRLGCGMGVVTDTELHATYKPDAPNTPIVAELLAIELALKTFSQKHLVIRTDSRDAIKLIGLTATELDARNRCGELHTDRYISSVVRRIHNASAGRQVSFKWVKGHDGDRLNEAADRAAKCVRRFNSYSIGSSALTQVLDNIRHDIAA